MEKKKPNQERKAKLEDEFEGIVSNVNFDPKQHFPTKEDIPGLGENQQTYDYDADMEECRNKATQMVTSLVKLHLGEDPKVLRNPMVVEKMEEDIDAYAYLKFMAKQSQRLYINNLTNIDNGQTGASMTEAVSTLQKEQRDTLKMLSQKFKEIDFSYRMLKDVLLASALPETQEEQTTIMDFKKMNSSIDEFMKDRAEQRLLEQEETRKKTISDPEKENSEEEPPTTEQPSEPQE
jgi:hypothetical protein